MNMNDVRIGMRACKEAIGIEFHNKYKDNCVYSYGEEDDGSVSCFLGLNTVMPEYHGLILTCDINEWEYYASCFVKDGKVTMDKCRLPKHDKSS